MTKTLTKTSRVLAASSCAGLVLAGVSSTPALAHTKTSHSPTMTVIASNLNNPRDLAWADGHLYLAEAGKGGTDCPPGATGPEGGPLCVGRTGSLDVLAHGTVNRVVTQLISMSDLPGGVASVGLAAVAPAGDHGVRVVFNESVVGLLTRMPPNASLTADDSATARAELGRVGKLMGHGFQYLSDVGDQDFTWAAVNQQLDPEFPDSDPNTVAVADGHTWVADAGANALVEVARNGGVLQRAFFPRVGASDGVPTCVAVGPDHRVYVGQLAPAGGPTGGSVYRYDPRTGHFAVWQTGFAPSNGCGFDEWGNFYVVEFQKSGFNPGPNGNPAGDIVKIARNGTRTVIAAGKLFYPSGFASDPWGNIYTSNWSILTDTPSAPGGPTGQVVKISQ